VERADTALQDWVVQKIDRTPASVAAAMHKCFEGVDTAGILPAIRAPVLLLSGDKSQISSAQIKVLADTLPSGRVEMFAGYGHGVNLLQPERCTLIWNSGTRHRSGQSGDDARFAAFRCDTRAGEAPAVFGRPCEELPAKPAAPTRNRPCSTRSRIHTVGDPLVDQ
jgi:hypothetical protein